MTVSTRKVQASELLDRATIDTPHEFFAALRAADPVAPISDTGVHAVSTWALIEEVLQREADFSSHLTGVLVRGEDGLPAVFEFPAGISGATQVIATADEPEHAIHRRLIQPRLAADRMAALEPRLRDWTRQGLAPWLDAGAGDFMPIAERIPALTVAHLLGLPEQDVEDFCKWAMMGGDMLAGDLSQGRLMTLAQETGRMAEYLNAHLEIAMQAPDVGLEAPLLHALARGVLDDLIDQAAAVGIAIVLFGAAGESTAALLGSAARVLAEREDLAERLREEPGLIGRFIEEVVRLEPPFKFHYRVVKRSCELGGVALERGDRLMLMWAAANRDPLVFEAPDEIRLDRRHPKHHLSFGRGAHFCIGAPLARLEARIVVEELLDAPGRLSLDPSQAPVHAPSIFTRRLERLPLRFESTALVGEHEP